MTNKGRQAHGPRRRSDTDDDAVQAPQGRGRRRFAVLSHGRLFRAVLRRCEVGVGDARHRADQARRRFRRADTDVRRSGAFGRGLSRPPDQGRAPCGDCRTDRKSGRSPQGEGIQGAGRSGDHPAGHAGHAHRGDVARKRVGQLAGRGRARWRRLGGCCGRHLDRSLRTDRLRAGRTRSRACAAVAGRDDCGFVRARNSDVGRQRRLRQPGRRALAQDPVRAGDARRPWSAVSGGAGRGGRVACLSRRNPEGRGDIARRAAADRAGPAHGDRRGDAREPGADALDLRHRQREPPWGDRPLPDGGRAALAVRRCVRAADGPQRDRGAAGAGGMAARGRNPARAGAAGAESHAGHRTCARPACGGAGLAARPCAASRWAGSRGSAAA